MCQSGAAGADARGKQNGDIQPTDHPHDGRYWGGLLRKWSGGVVGRLSLLVYYPVCIKLTFGLWPPGNTSDGSAAGRIEVGGGEDEKVTCVVTWPEQCLILCRMECGRGRLNYGISFPSCMKQNIFEEASRCR